MSARFVCLGLALLLGLAVPLPLSHAANGDEIVVTVLEGEALIRELDREPETRFSGSVRFGPSTAVDVITLPGTRVHVTLPSGSEVEVGASARAHFNATRTAGPELISRVSGSIVVNIPPNVEGAFVVVGSIGGPGAHVEPLPSEGRTTYGVGIDRESGDPTVAVQRGDVAFQILSIFGDRSPLTRFLGPGSKSTYRFGDKEFPREDFKPGTSLFNDPGPVEGERDGTKVQGRENPGTGKPEQPKDKKKDDDKDKDQSALPIPPSALAFQTASVSVPEGNSGLQVGSTTLNLAPPSTNVVSVQFAAVDGTATIRPAGAAR